MIGGIYKRGGEGGYNTFEESYLDSAQESYCIKILFNNLYFYTL